MIRISQGERDASARATHLEAATRKFLVTTNERKYMSTKTNFKRIALVAVAALGLGVLSSAPSQATFTGLATAPLTLSTTNGTAGLSNVGGASDSTTAGTFTLTALSAAVTDSVAVSSVMKSKPAAASSANSALVFMLNDTGTSTAMPIIAVKDYPGSTIRVIRVLAGNVATDTSTEFSIAPATSQAAGYVVGTWKVFMDSNTASATRVAGTYVYTIIATSSAPAVTQTVDISFTVTAAASASVTISPSLSTAFIGTSSSSNTEDAVISAAATASATPAAYISTRTYNASGTAMQESVTVSITGAGTLFFGSVGGTSLTIAGDGSDEIQVRPDGRAGVAVISVSTPTRTFAAKNVTFYSSAAKTISAAVYNPTLLLGANSTAIAATAVDSTGTNWAGAMYIVASAAADALVGGSATTPVACAYSAADKTHFCPVSTIATGTAKFKLIDAATVALATATSNELTLTVANNPVASIKLAFNKATYQAGEKAYITVTALDAAGKTLQGQTHSSLLASGGITTSYAFGNGSDTLTMTSIATSVSNSATTPSTAGAKTYTVYMPTTGSVKITATGGASVALSGQVEVSATATVTDAAAAATAAATAALAAVTALATTVASLKTLITTLTNLVLKIQKKVKA